MYNQIIKYNNDIIIKNIRNLSMLILLSTEGIPLPRVLYLTTLYLNDIDIYLDNILYTVNYYAYNTCTVKGIFAG